METTPSAERSIREAKIRASLLLKDLRSRQPLRVRAAAERLRRLPCFAELSLERIAALDQALRRKHALDAIACEWGYDSWLALRTGLNETAAPEIDTEAFFRMESAVYLNRWFAHYDEARASLAAEGGFLFPYRSQFFVCEAGLLKSLGIDVADADWQRIGGNWVEPADRAAHARLAERLARLGLAS